MKNHSVSFFACFIMVGVLAFIIGCASTPLSKFYVLDSIEGHEVQQNGADSMQNITVGIDSVKIPDYLDRSQIVTRSNRSELKVDEFNRWAGSLKENISLILAENLSFLLSTNRVFVHPRIPVDSVNYWIHIEIIRLDIIPGNNVTMKALWTISGDRDKKEFITRSSGFTESVIETGYDAIVAGISRIFGKLSYKIASEIEKLK